MKKTTKLSLLLALSATGANPALADDKNLPNILVQEEAGLKTYDVYSEPKSFKNNTQTFTEKDFKSLPINSVYEMLDYGTGAYIKNHGRKSPVFPSIRAGSNLGIILDGAYLLSPAASKVLMHLPVSAVKSMKVVRDASALNLGPLSSMVGPMTSNRTEGFLVIETFGAHEKAGKTNLNAKVGSHGEVGADLSFGDKLGESLAARGTLAYETKDGKPEYYNGYQRQVGLWKLAGYHDKFDWQVNFFHSDGEMELQRGQKPGVNDQIANAKWEYDPMEMRMLNSQAGFHWNENNTTAIRLGYTDSRASLQQRSHVNPNMHTTEDTIEKFYSFDLSHSVKFANNALRFGYNQMHYDNPTGMLFYPGFAKKETYKSWYLQNETQFNKFTVDAGARIDQRTIDKGYEQLSMGDNGPRRLIEDVKLDDLLTFALGGSYEMSEKTLFTARSLYTEQQPVSVYTTNSSQLPKENRIRLELGWSQAWLPALNTNVTLFNERLKDAAYVAKQVTQTDGTLLNVYDTKSWENNGIEVEFKGRYQKIGYEIGLSYVDLGDENATNVPNSLARARVFYDNNVWNANLGIRAVDEYASSSHASAGKVGNFQTVDASVGRKIHWLGYEHKVSVYGKNLTDKKYETMAGFPNEGLNLGVSYSVEF